MSLVCPYCRDTFEASEIVFMADAVENTRTSSNDIVVHNGERGGGTDASALLNSRHKASIEDEEQEKQQVAQALRNRNERSWKKIPRVYGKNDRDPIIEDFVRTFGSSLSHTTTAIFYRVKPKNEIAEDDVECGYPVANEKSPDGELIPLTIEVPSRDPNRSRVTTRVCPHCHCRIPNGYFEVPESQHLTIALAGCSSSGKTQFMVAALRDWSQEMRNLQQGEIGSNRITVQECSSWYLDKLYVPQYTKKKLAATKMDYPLFPMVVRIENKDSKKYFVTFLDCAGEYANDAHSDYAVNLRSFRDADIIMLMLAPEQFYGSDTNLEKDNGELACEEHNYEQGLENIRISLRAVAPEERHLKHLIAVVTKLDTIMGNSDRVHGNTANANDAMLVSRHDLSIHQNGVRMQAIHQIDQELASMLGAISHQTAEQMKSSIARDIIDEDHVTMLGVSTYRWSDVDAQDVPADSSLSNRRLTNDKPDIIGGRHRLIEPLLLSMEELGILAADESELVLPQEELPEEPVKLTPKRRSWWFFGKH